MTQVHLNLTTENITSYRVAARRLLKEPLAASPRTQALLRLYGRAKGESDAEMVIGAIVAEIGFSIDRRFAPDLERGDALERRHRRLRGRGFSACPECLSELSSEVDWQTWAMLREAEVRELEARG